VQKFEEKQGCLAVMDAGCPWEMLTTPRSRIHICKEPPRWLIITQKPVLHRMQVMLIMNYGKSVLDISPMIRAIVTAPAM